MPAARDPLYDGPVVVVSGRAAALLSRPLGRLLREARDRGERIDHEVIAIANAIERAGHSYATSRVLATSDSGTGALPIADTRSPSDPDDWLSTSAVADRLGCGERNVVRLITEGRLVSIRVGRNHRIERSELARYLEDRTRTG